MKSSEIDTPIGAQMVAVDPALAASLLSTSPEYQRAIRPNHVVDLAAQMSADGFGMTVIQLGVRNGSDHLIDGHHRMLAVIESGKTIPFMVWRRTFETDAEMEKAYTQIDGGIKRTKSDIQRVVKMDELIGVPHSVSVAATSAVGLIASSFNGTPNRADWKRLEKYGIVTRQQQAEAPFLFNKEIYAYWRICNVASNHVFRKLLRPAVMAVGLACFYYQPEKAESLWSEVSMADGLRRYSPAQMLYEGINDSKEIGSMTRYVASCWNAHYEVRDMGKFVLPRPSQPIIISGTPWRGANTTDTGLRMIDDMWKGRRPEV